MPPFAFTSCFKLKVVMQIRLDLIAYRRACHTTQKHVQASHSDHFFLKTVVCLKKFQTTLLYRQTLAALC